MLLIAIYALFHIKTLLQTILGFSIRGIIGFLFHFVSAAFPFALLALLWLDRGGKLQKKNLITILLWAEAVTSIYLAIRHVRTLFIFPGELNLYAFLRGPVFMPALEAILFALLFLMLAIAATQKKARPVPFMVLAGVIIFYLLFFGILKQLTGSGSLFLALIDTLFLIGLYNLPKLLTDPTSVEITPQRSKNLRAIVILTLVIALISGIAVGGGGGGGGSRDSNTCKSCHRSWEAGDSGGNFMNIARTGMCKNCYGNYNSLKGFIGK